MERQNSSTPSCTCTIFKSPCPLLHANYERIPMDTKEMAKLRKQSSRTSRKDLSHPLRFTIGDSVRILLSNDVKEGVVLDDGKTEIKEDHSCIYYTIQLNNEKEERLKEPFTIKVEERDLLHSTLHYETPRSQNQVLQRMVRDISFLDKLAHESISS